MINVSSDIFFFVQNSKPRHCRYGISSIKSERSKYSTIHCMLCTHAASNTDDKRSMNRGKYVKGFDYQFMHPKISYEYSMKLQYVS